MSDSFYVQIGDLVVSETSERGIVGMWIMLQNCEVFYIEKDGVFKPNNQKDFLGFSIKSVEITHVGYLGPFDKIYRVGKEIFSELYSHKEGTCDTANIPT